MNYLLQALEFSGFFDSSYFICFMYMQYEN
jgi:hypothetical protein